MGVWSLVMGMRWAPDVLPFVSFELGYYSRSVHYTRWTSHHEQHMERNLFIISIDNIGNVYSTSTTRTTYDRGATKCFVTTGLLYVTNIQDMIPTDGAQQ